MIKHKDQRVGILVDVSNMYHSAKNLYHKRVNFKEVLKEAVAGRKLIRATAYVISTESEEESSFFEALSQQGFEVKMITYEAWRLETQIIKRMLERIGLKVKIDVLTYPEWARKTVIPVLDRPPEEQEWDIDISYLSDWYSHTGASLLVWYTEGGGWRWNEYDPVYEEMWEDMARTVDRKAQEKKIRQMVQYVYDRAHAVFIYSPLTLYAVNKEVDFVPQKFLYLRLKETSVTDNHWSVRGEKK